MKNNTTIVDVNGMSIEDILDMDMMSLSSKDLKKVASRLVSASNKRLQRLEKAGLTNSPSYRQYTEDRGVSRFSTKGKTMAQTRREMAQMKHFLQNKTSTVSGWKNVQKKTKETIQNRLDLTDEQINNYDWSNYWNLYRKIESEHRGAMDSIKGGSTEIQKELYKVLQKSEDEDDALLQMDWFIDDLYNGVYEDLEDYDDGFDDEELF